jgi:N4-gp56 family major capsid protein
MAQYDLIITGGTLIDGSGAPPRQCDIAVKALQNANVPKIPDAMGGHYVGMIHPDVNFDLRGDTGWKNADLYGGSVKLYSGEAGMWNGTRLIINSMAKKYENAGAGGIDVYSSLVFGQHWFGTVKWMDETGGQRLDLGNGYGAEIFVKPLGYGNDPLNQRGSVGWKASHVLKILNQLCGVQIRSSAS